MKQKYLSLISISVLFLMLGGMLSGCGLKPAEDANEAEAVLEEPQAPVEPAPVEPAAIPAPVITDAELDQEIKAIDDALETVKVTGFEQTDLADKDLGL